MMRFAKPNGDPFDLDYTGPIHAFDSGNDLIAICRGVENLDIDCPHSYDEECDCDLEEDYEISSDPRCWDDWEVVVALNEEAEILLLQALATAYNAIAMCERMVLSEQAS